MIFSPSFSKEVFFGVFAFCDRDDLLNLSQIDRHVSTQTNHYYDAPFLEETWDEFSFTAVHTLLNYGSVHTAKKVEKLSEILFKLEEVLNHGLLHKKTTKEVEKLSEILFNSRYKIEQSLFNRIILFRGRALSCFHELDFLNIKSKCENNTSLSTQVDMVKIAISVAASLTPTQKIEADYYKMLFDARVLKPDFSKALLIFKEMLTDIPTPERIRQEVKKLLPKIQEKYSSNMPPFTPRIESSSLQLDDFKSTVGKTNFSSGLGRSLKKTAIDTMSFFDRFTTIEALIQRVPSEEERQAAQLIKDRILTKIALDEAHKPVAYRISFGSSWEKRLFIALCRKHGFKTYRYKKQKFTTVRLNISKIMMDEVLWPDYLQYSKMLKKLIKDITQGLINKIHKVQEPRMRIL